MKRNVSAKELRGLLMLEIHRKVLLAVVVVRAVGGSRVSILLAGMGWYRVSKAETECHELWTRSTY